MLGAGKRTSVGGNDGIRARPRGRYATSTNKKKVASQRAWRPHPKGGKPKATTAHRREERSRNAPLVAAFSSPWSGCFAPLLFG